MKTNLLRFSLIKYIGSKRALIPWIVEVVDAVGQGTEIKQVVDLFSGSGRVGHAFKSQGYFVASNDINAYAHILATSLVQADRNQYPPELLQPMFEHLMSLEGKEGYFTQTFCREARFFQPKNGARVDAMRSEIEIMAKDDPVLRAILLTSLILAADRVDSTTGVQMAYLKQWAPRAHKDMELRYPEILPGPGQAFKTDALELASEVQGDLIYLDPPYNQHAYLSNYHIWETLVLQDQPEAYGIARKRIDCRTRKSPFNSKRKAAEALQSVLQNINIENVLLSFSNEGVFSVEDIAELMGQKGQVTTLWREHKRYIGARIGIYNPSGKKVGKVSHTKNREYLFLASPNPAVHEAVAAQLAKSTEQLAAVV